jgi:hypothetical protein
MKNLFWMGFYSCILLIFASLSVASAEDFLAAKDRLMMELGECDEKVEIDPSTGVPKSFAEWSQCYWSKKLDFFSKDPDSAPFMDIFRKWAASEVTVWEKVDRDEIKLENAKNIISTLEKIYEEAIYERLSELENAQRAKWEMPKLMKEDPAQRKPKTEDDSHFKVSKRY